MTLNNFKFLIEYSFGSLSTRIASTQGISKYFSFESAEIDSPQRHPGSADFGREGAGRFPHPCHHRHLQKSYLLNHRCLHRHWGSEWHAHHLHTPPCQPGMSDWIGGNYGLLRSTGRFTRGI